MNQALCKALNLCFPCSWLCAWDKWSWWADKYKFALHTVCRDIEQHFYRKLWARHVIALHMIETWQKLWPFRFLASQDSSTDQLLLYLESTLQAAAQSSRQLTQDTNGFLNGVCSQIVDIICQSPIEKGKSFLVHQGICNVDSTFLDYQGICLLIQAFTPQCTLHVCWYAWALQFKSIWSRCKW